MSNKSPLLVRKAQPQDPRVRRSTHALGAALVELMLERDFGSITVQSILDRAGVGRSTFYAHYRNKQDVLHSSYERMFAGLERLLDRPSAYGARLVPVAEFFSHVGEAGAVVDALRSAGQLEAMWDLGVAYVARMIERRIAAAPGTTPCLPPSLVARMLAGALMEMVQWWRDHQATWTPARMDLTFHELARATLRRASYEVRAY
jgi:AcrR family transcriptional regulator